MTGSPEPSVTWKTTGCKMLVAETVCATPCMTAMVHNDGSTPTAEKLPQRFAEAPIVAQAEPFAVAPAGKELTLAAIVASPFVLEMLCDPAGYTRDVELEVQFTAMPGAAAPLCERAATGESSTVCPAAT